MARCSRSILMELSLSLVLAMGFAFPLVGTAGAKDERAPVVEVPAKYAAELPECDRVEVFLLGEMQDEEGKGTFPIRPYKQFAKVEKMREVKGDAAKKLCAAWRGVTFDYMNQALCHHPVYGVRFYAGETLQFETSICFGCSNFYYPREGGGTSWHGFQAKDEAGKALRSALEEVMPLPKEEGKVDEEAMLVEVRKKMTEKLYGEFLYAERDRDFVRMKEMMAEVKAIDPESGRLPDMELKLALRSKDWAGLKRGLESIPASEAKESAVRELARDFMVKEAGWDDSPEEVMAVFAKAVEEAWKSREEAGSKPVAGDYLVLCRMYWKAGDKKAAVEWVQKAKKLEEDSGDGKCSVTVKRYVESVEAGRLPTNQEVGEWDSEAE